MSILLAFVDGPQRFNELCRITGVNPNTLSDRLKDFEAEGIIERSVLSAIPPKVEYSLTQDGAELVGLLRQLQDWLRKHAICS